MVAEGKHAIDCGHVEVARLGGVVGKLEGEILELKWVFIFL